MKFFPYVVFVSLITGQVVLHGQSATSPDNTSVQAANAQEATAVAAPSPSATVPVEPPSLIPPNTLPAADALPQIPAAPELQILNSYFKSTSLGKAADEHRLHLQMVALETRIRNDADLKALKATALRVPTDLERRHRLKDYYERYYGRLRSLASTPELKAYLDAQKAAHQLALLQPRVRHESDEAEAAALAAASQGMATALPTPAQAKAGQIVQP